jgi:hypothetical protein
MNVLGLLRYVFLALLVLFVVYLLGLIRRDLDR